MTQPPSINGKYFLYVICSINNINIMKVAINRLNNIRGKIRKQSNIYSFDWRGIKDTSLKQKSLWYLVHD